MNLNTAIDSRYVVENDLGFICSGLDKEFSTMAGKRLLVTGGAGFLGYYLVQAVLHWNSGQSTADRIRVTIFDNYLRGIPDWLLQLNGTENLSTKYYDIAGRLPDGMEDYQYIIHAASIASPTYYRKYPIQTMDANVGGLRNLLSFCVDKKAGKSPIEGFLFFSSSEVYGNPMPENIPTPEDYNGNVSFTGPRACYDESKRYGETLCVNFAEHHGIAVKSARPFNNYGPGLRITDRRVIPDFARDILSGKDIVMYSDGLPTRTFCYVADAVIGYFKVLVKGRPGHAYNIGVEQPEISIGGLAEMMTEIAGELYGYKGKVVTQTSQDGKYLIDNPDRRCPDISKARTELGYAPAVSLNEGLRRSLIWYYDHRTEGEL